MKTVLVIEDNEDNLDIMKIALERSGYAVIAAGTGEEGIEVALRERPFFIIMDINLPGMDGIETTRNIRNSPLGADIPIIAITSFAMVGDRERILEAGCNGYFEKPIDPLTIMEKIHKIIRG